MIKRFLFFGILYLMSFGAIAQENRPHDLRAGIIFQKTHYLYLENGIGVDYSHANILNKQLHLKASYISSRFGSAMATNAIKQDNILLGADWRFRAAQGFEFPLGLNVGYFVADYEDPTFDALPNKTWLLSLEGGVVYNFDFPVSLSLTAGYNFNNGNGVDVPGTLFPVFYKLSVYYRF